MSLTKMFPKGSRAGVFESHTVAYLCSMAGVYIHVPFCRQACYYCDFHFSTKLDLQESMAAAIAQELSLQRGYLKGQQVDTIYFGGGTPSLLSRDQLQLILDTVRTGFPVASQPEVTLEANPDDLTPSKLAELQELGVNRLSIGVQSFHDDVLRFFHRAHDSAQAKQSLADARKAGFDNISVDLIYGVPGQDITSWEADIQQLLAFRPEHISTYALTIEERTVFGNWRDANKLVPLEEGRVADHYEHLMEVLHANGYDHYEISNFSLPGRHSRHNSSYWTGTHYLGVGPSAHSFDGASRQFNVANNIQYLKKMELGEVPFDREVLSRADQVNERLLIGLRTSAGCDLGEMKQKLGFAFNQAQSQYVARLIAQGLAVLDSERLRLTNRGKLLADKIASDLFVTPE